MDDVIFRTLYVTLMCDPSNNDGTLTAEGEVGSDATFVRAMFISLGS